ncbi:MAG: isoprenylcysteine carboxylmethyltransferase family protein [Gammaproteobacteria bacterium]|jgi:protein-S-isoprenylcysteine O-methyltransferase Ste14
MSHRTQNLPPQNGLTNLVRELRYHEPSRQVFAVVLIGVFTITAEPVPVLVYVGALLALLGTLIRLHASGFVLKNKELAREGPYAMMRHPLYTGNIVVVIGFALAGSTMWALPLSLVFFWFYYPPAIEYEDRKLKRIFGREWDEWSRETPALIPRFGRFGSLFRGNWSFARSTWKNGEIFIAIYIVICMAVIIGRLESM